LPARNSAAATTFKQRTLTALYNTRGTPRAPGSTISIMHSTQQSPPPMAGPPTFGTLLVLNPPAPPAHPIDNRCHCDPGLGPGASPGLDRELFSQGDNPRLDPGEAIPRRVPDYLPQAPSPSPNRHHELLFPLTYARNRIHIAPVLTVATLSAPAAAGAVERFLLVGGGLLGVIRDRGGRSQAADPSSARSIAGWIASSSALPSSPSSSASAASAPCPQTAGAPRLSAQHLIAHPHPRPPIVGAILRCPGSPPASAGCSASCPRPSTTPANCAIAYPTRISWLCSQPPPACSERCACSAASSASTSPNCPPPRSPRPRGHRSLITGH
jgi:hypothetical protein